VNALQPKKLHAGRILFALARYFNWWQNRMITELEIEGLREDLTVISRSGYATVIEIKISRADWDRDQHKARWPSKQITRFFYAVPISVFERGIPAHVPEHCGILVVAPGGHWAGFDDVWEQRAARRLKAEKFTDAQLRKIDEAFYFRFWRQHMERERLRLFDRPAMNRAAV
jgi:hypothetical protein